MIRWLLLPWTTPRYLMTSALELQKAFEVVGVILVGATIQVIVQDVLRRRKWRAEDEEKRRRHE